MRRYAWTYAVVAVFALLLGYRYLWGPARARFFPPPPAPAPRVEPVAKILDFDASRATRLVLVGEAGKLVLSRDGSGVWSAGGRDAKPNQDAVERILKAASSLAASREIAESASGRPEFGLDVSKRSIEVELGDQGRKVLRVGDEVPTGGYFYVASGDSERVYTVPAYQVDTIIPDDSVLFSKD